MFKIGDTVTYPLVDSDRYLVAERERLLHCNAEVYTLLTHYSFTKEFRYVLKSYDTFIACINNTQYNRYNDNEIVNLYTLDMLSGLYMSNTTIQHFHKFCRLYGNFHVSLPAIRKKLENGKEIKVKYNYKDSFYQYITADVECVNYDTIHQNKDTNNCYIPVRQYRNVDVGIHRYILNYDVGIPYF